MLDRTLEVLLTVQDLVEQEYCQRLPVNAQALQRTAKPYFEIDPGALEATLKQDKDIARMIETKQLGRVRQLRNSRRLQRRKKQVGYAAQAEQNFGEHSTTG